MSAWGDVSNVLDPGHLLLSDVNADEAKAKKAAAAQKTAVDAWQELSSAVPSASHTAYDPTLEGPSIDQARSEMWGAVADPDAVRLQREAGQGMRDIVAGRGLTEADRARMLLADTEMQNTMAGQRGAIQQNMAERGMGGGGSELAALLSGQQQASQNRALQQAQVSIAAQGRSDAALQGLAGLGSGMRQQSFGEQAAQREAQDAINRFNTEGQRGTQQRNTDRQNAGGLYNAEATDRQRRAHFDAWRDLTAGKSNAQMGYGTSLQGQAEADKDRQAAKSGTVVGGLIGLLSDRAAKHDIRPADAETDRVLAALAPYVYRYRDPVHGAGQILGVIAQDLDGAGVTEIGDDGLMRIDMHRALSLALAAVARLGARVRQLEARHAAD